MHVYHILSIDKSHTFNTTTIIILGFGNVSSVGSCVLLALNYNHKLVLANCGDCRAILGTVIRSDRSNNISNGDDRYSFRKLTITKETYDFV